MPQIILYGDARKRGLKRYYTGKPCKHGHVTFRRTVNGCCCACAKKRTEDWRKKNRRHLQLYGRKWWKKNRDYANEYRRELERRNPRYMLRCRAGSRAWAAKNRAYLTKYRREWARKNKAREATYTRNKRSRRRGNAGRHTLADVVGILRKQKGRCAYCACRITYKNKTVDHVVASFNGGSNGRRNLRVACRPCNSSKGIRDIRTFLRGRK